jgi:hypothetical protein
VADVGCDGVRAASTSLKTTVLERKGLLLIVEVEASCEVVELAFTRFTGAVVLASTRSSLNFVILTSAENASAVVAIISGPKDEAREIVL